MTESQDRYGARGVSSSKADVHAAVGKRDAGLFPGAFCTLVPDIFTGDPEQCLLMHADGAGTKSALAYLAVKEGRPTSVWGGIAQDALVMNLDDAACVGAVGPFLACNTMGRNAKLVGGDAVNAVISGYDQVCTMLAMQGIICQMVGGETADVGDLVRTAIVDATIVARLPRNRVVDASRMVPGDIIVGFSSTEKAIWEDLPNSGIGSNGLTSARHDVLNPDYRRYTETFAPETDLKLIYCGAHRLYDPLPGAPGWGVGPALLSPTRTYLPLVRRILGHLAADEIRDYVHGLIHCSGGGQTKIGKFGAPGNRYVKNRLFQVPPLFAMLQAASGQSWEEMYRVYNMGHRLEAVVTPNIVDYCIQIAEEECGIAAQVVGRVEQGDGPGREVVIRTEHGEFRYS